MIGRYYFRLWLLSIIIILGGCNPVNSATGMELPAISEGNLPKATQSLEKKETATPTCLAPTAKVTLGGVATQVMQASELPKKPELPLKKATPTCLPEITICCPLEEFPLKNISKIVSVPYDPPPMGSDERHQGVDFVYHRLAGVDIPILGVPVTSVLPGFVAAAVTDSFPYGSLVIIETPGRWLPASWLEALGMTDEQSLYTLYAHLLEKPPVNLGDQVVRCQEIGKVGKSGNTNAAHLHFETRIGPAGYVFPCMYGLLAEAPEEARQNYKLWRTSGVFQHFDPMLLLSGLPAP